MANSSKLMAPETARFLSLLSGFTPAGVALAFEKEYGQAVTRIKGCVHFTRRITNEGSFAGIRPLHPHRTTVPREIATQTIATNHRHKPSPQTIAGQATQRFAGSIPSGNLHHRWGIFEKAAEDYGWIPGTPAPAPFCTDEGALSKQRIRWFGPIKRISGPNTDTATSGGEGWLAAVLDRPRTGRGLEAPWEQVGTAPIGVRDAQHRVHHLLLDRLEGP